MDIFRKKNITELLKKKNKLTPSDRFLIMLLGGYPWRQLGVKKRFLKCKKDIESQQRSIIPQTRDKKKFCVGNMKKHEKKVFFPGFIFMPGFVVGYFGQSPAWSHGLTSFPVFQLTPPAAA